MEQASTQTIATFNGVLLRRERAAGQHFVQLVFREADKDWLCLSSNLANAKLQIGKDYRIEGIFKRLGERAYIHEPQIQLLTRQIVKRRVMISLVIALIILLTAGGIVLAASHHDTAAPPANNTSETSGEQTSTTADNGSSNAPVNATPQTPTDTATPVATTTPTTTKKTAQTKPAPTTPTVLSSPAVAPVPYCDAPVVTQPFDSKTVTDPTAPVDSSVVTQQGVNGQSQTCYPDGTAASAVTNPYSTEQDQITTVGPASTPGPVQ